MSLLLAPMLPEGVGSEGFLVDAAAALMLVHSSCSSEVTNRRITAQVALQRQKLASRLFDLCHFVLRLLLFTQCACTLWAYARFITSSRRW